MSVSKRQIHFIFMSNPLAALEGYPKEGPEVPEREKVKREKDRHDPGTGRRDREKRQGKGGANWGDPVHDQLAAQDENEPQEDGEGPDRVESKPAEYTKPDLGDEDDEEVVKTAPKVLKVPPGLKGMVKPGENEVVVEEEVDLSHCPKPKPQAKPKPKHSDYKPEPETHEKPAEEPEAEDGDTWKKGRNQSRQAVQHNRTSNNQAHAPKGNFH